MAKADLTAARLRELLHYDPETGVFTSRVVRNQLRPGQPVGYLNDQSYIWFIVDCRYYKAHRAAWLYMTGEWPKHQIDHINRVKDDNRWANLRDVPAAVNSQNRRHSSKSGLLGVSPDGRRWRTQISVGGVDKWLGRFDTPEEAHAVYLEAKRRLHEGCTI